MALNPNISLAVRGIELQDPLAQYGKFAAIQNAQQQNQLAQMQMQKGQREQEDLNRLRMLDPASPGYIENVTRINPELGFSLGNRRQQQITAERQATSADAEIRGKNLSYWQAKARDASRAPTDDALGELKREAITLGLADEAAAESTFQKMLAMPLEERAQMLSKSGAPAYVPTPRASQLKTPEEEAQALRIAIGSRPPEPPKDDPRLVVANTITDAAGNVTQYNKFGEVVGDVKKGAGKPSATYEKTKALQKQMGVDLDRAITELETITKPGGLIEQSTGSGIGRAADAAAGFFGTATPGAIAIGKLKPIADLTLKMVPRFEGPQSDKDTQSYKEAAGQLADASLPTGIRLAAAKEVLRLMKSRRAQFVTPEMAVEGLSPISQGGASGSFDVPPDIQAILDKNKPKAR